MSFWGKNTKTITRVISLIFTNSFYICFFDVSENDQSDNDYFHEKFQKSFRERIRKNPRIHPKYHFRISPQKLQSILKIENLETQRNSAYPGN